MSRARTVKSVLAAIIACCSLVAVTSAGAAAWQGPISISDAAPVSVGDTTARIALGVNGDAAAGWTDDDQMGGATRLVLVRRRAGGTWSAPTVVTTGINPMPILVGVDGAGDVTAAYTSVGPVAQIISWAAGSTTPTTTPLPSAAVNISALAVNANGDAVVSGVEQVTNNVMVAYRHGFTGAWSNWHGFTGPTFMSGIASSVAINATGQAVVIFRTFSELWSATRSATVDWPSAAVEVTSTPVSTVETPSVAINAAGGIYTAFTVEPAAGTDFLHTAYLDTPASAWEESGNLASAATSVAPQLVMNPSGTALLVWQQTSASAIQARLGSTGSRIWGQVETVNDAGADVPIAAIGNDGTAIVAWERFVGGGNLGQARVRSPGASGTWGDIRNLTALHANGNQPSISTDGLGDFVTITAPYDGTTKHAMISIYDAAPPVVTAPVFAGTQILGDPLSFSVSASDSWSGVGAPAWTFGDGGTATGLGVAHTYGGVGPFPVTVTVADGSGNSATSSGVVGLSKAQAALTTARFSARWKVSRVRGTLLVAGSVPRAGSYAIDVAKGAKRRIHASFDLPAGAFSKKLKLPATLVPGAYRVSLSPASSNIGPAGRDVKLAAPASGVVDKAFLTGARNGTAARTLTGATTIWANFHFAAKPKGKLTLTWYKLGKRRIRLGSTSKDSAVKVISYLRSSRAFRGVYQAVLTRRGVVIFRVSVKAKA
jgi:hypothetical protein